LLIGLEGRIGQVLGVYFLSLLAQIKEHHFKANEAEKNKQNPACRK
jgi:hypothetical protein